MTITRRSMLLSSLAAAAVRGQTRDAVAERIQADLAKHASFGIKRSGTPGDLATAAWVADRLRMAGYRVDVLDFEAPFFVERNARLSLTSATERVYVQTPAKPTGASGVSGPLRVVRTIADAADTKGMIALVVLANARHAAMGRGNAGTNGILLALAQAGALGAVIVTTGPSREAAMLNVPEEVTMPLPVAILAPRLADRFLDAAAAGVPALLIIDGDQTHRPSKNVVAKLERGPRWIAISTPRSGWFDCVGERGVGTSIFLELAEWAVDRFPRHSIFLMNTGGHEYYFAGSHKVLHLGPAPPATDIWTHIGASLAVRDAVEESGKLRLLDTADPQRYIMATPTLSAAIADAFRGIPELAAARPVRPEAGELSTFTDRGYQKAFAAIGVHRWFHTVEDTLDKVDGGLVKPVLEGHQRVIEAATV